jgi:hypothetical protein
MVEKGEKDSVTPIAPAISGWVILIQSVMAQMGKSFVQGLIAMVLVGVVAWTFLDGDGSISNEAMVGFVGIVLGFFFGKASNGEKE